MKVRLAFQDQYEYALVNPPQWRSMNPFMSPVRAKNVKYFRKSNFWDQNIAVNIKDNLFIRKLQLVLDLNVQTDSIRAMITSLFHALY